MQSEFKSGGKTGGLTQQISVNNPLRHQSIKGNLSQQLQTTFMLLTAEIAEQKKLLTQMKELSDAKKKQSDDRRHLTERLRVVAERAAMSCEQFAMNTEKIEKESGYFIDTLNSQE